MGNKNPTKGVMQSNNSVSKNFSYELDGVALNVTLRIDVKKDLKAWLQILERCKADVEEELKKL